MPPFRLVHQSQNKSKCAVDGEEGFVIDLADRGTQPMAAQGNDFVDHDLRAGFQPGLGARLQDNAEQWSIHPVACDKANQNACVSRIEKIRLNHDSRSWLAEISGCGDDDNVASAHHVSSAAPIASMSATVSRSLFRRETSLDCRRSSSAILPERVSAAQICTGRRPWARNRDR